MKTRHSTKTVLIALLCIGVASGCSESQQLETAELDDVHTNSISSDSSDDVPGFGISAENAMRDDTIALFEAYQREAIVNACMKEAGLDYEIEVAFPIGVAIKIASTMELPDPHGLSQLGTLVGAGDRNRQRASVLSVTEQERYFQNLYGESAADMALVESTGELPEGRADFARGGCYGKSWEAIPGVYAMKRNLTSQINIARKKQLEEKSSSVVNECGGLAGNAVSALVDNEVSIERNQKTASSECINALVVVAQSARVSALQSV
nr:hypothetical protein [Granulosicoccus sp.]